MREFKFQNEEKYIIREAKTSDAKELIEYLKMISGESDNMTFGPGEVEFTIEKQEKYLDEIIKGDRSIFLLAEYNNKIIGTLSLTSYKKPRLKHVTTFGISVAKAYWNNRVATNMYKCFEKWKDEINTIRKINLEVKKDNTTAIELYKKWGFEIEGERKRSFFINDEYHSTLFMGKIID